MSKPLLCVTVTATTTAELRHKRDAVVDADLIELRLDSVSDPSAAGALEGRRRPVIITCRPAWEGGRFTGPEADRRQILADAVALGAEWVDLEWRANFDALLAQTGGRGIVLSCHDFDGVPSDLSDRVQVMRSTGAEVIKIAAKTSNLSDCVPLLHLGAHAGRGTGTVIVGMGETGLATRVLGGRFGSKWVYAGSERDLGQMSAETLAKEYHFRRLSEATEVYGLVGKPVSHSVSPAMHNAAFDAVGCDAVYLPFPATSAEDFVTFARAVGIKGASITTPYKTAMLDHVDESSVAAQQIGAINTVHVRDGRWIGENADATAFLQPLLERVPLEGTRAAILGAGGAARAVAVALASSGARVRVHARHSQRAERVAALASGDVGAWPVAPGSWDLLVNCTPVGMHPSVDDTPVTAGDLTGRYVYDLIYNPTTTRLLREAQQAGCHTIGGLDMLVAQAHEQFQWWTGARPPHGVMRDAALKMLAEFGRDAHYVV